MEQLSVYEEAEMTSQDTAKNQPQVVNFSATPDVVNDGDAAPQSSITAGPAGPMTCHQDPSSNAPLVMLPSSLPRPFAMFEGPGIPPRAPNPAPGPHKLLPDSCYVPPPAPWSWPGRGSDVPAFFLPLVLPVMLPSDAGAPAPALQSSVAFRPGPPTSHLTQWRTPCPSPPRLARFFCNQVLLCQHAQQDLPAFCRRLAYLLDTKYQKPLCHLPHLLFLTLHLPRWISHPPRP